MVEISKEQRSVKMIEITYNNKLYHIQKEKLTFVLEKLKGSKVNENEIKELMKKFELYDEHFLEHVNKI